MNRILCSLATIVILTAMSLVLGTADGFGQESDPAPSQPAPTPQSQETPDLSKYGVVEYNSPPIEDRRKWERRHQINRRYDNQDWVVKSISNPEVGGVGKITEDPPPPLFPIDESALIVVGKIETVKAYLSNDKGGVYTEFTIRVEDLLKGDPSMKQDPKKVTADREGGLVVYPNGQQVMYQNSNLGLPQLGSKYLFFLRKDELSPNLEILTSYDLSSNPIMQMEMGRDFDEFKGQSKRAFIETVRNEIARLRSQ